MPAPELTENIKKDIQELKQKRKEPLEDLHHYKVFPWLSTYISGVTKLDEGVNIFSVDEKLELARKKLEEAKLASYEEKYQKYANMLAAMAIAVGIFALVSVIGSELLFEGVGDAIKTNESSRTATQRGLIAGAVLTPFFSALVGIGLFVGYFRMGVTLKDKAQYRQKELARDVDYLQNLKDIADTGQTYTHNKANKMAYLRCSKSDLRITNQKTLKEKTSELIETLKIIKKSDFGSTNKDLVDRLQKLAIAGTIMNKYPDKYPDNPAVPAQFIIGAENLYVVNEKRIYKVNVTDKAACEGKLEYIGPHSTNPHIHPDIINTIVSNNQNNETAQDNLIAEVHNIIHSIQQSAAGAAPNGANLNFRSFSDFIEYARTNKRNYDSELKNDLGQEHDDLANKIIRVKNEESLDIRKFLKDQLNDIVEQKVKTNKEYLKYQQLTPTEIDALDTEKKDLEDKLRKFETEHKTASVALQAYSGFIEQINSASTSSTTGAAAGAADDIDASGSSVLAVAGTPTANRSASDAQAIVNDIEVEIRKQMQHILESIDNGQTVDAFLASGAQAPNDSFRILQNTLEQVNNALDQDPTAVPAILNNAMKDISTLISNNETNMDGTKEQIKEIELAQEINDENQNIKTTEHNGTRYKRIEDQQALDRFLSSITNNNQTNVNTLKRLLNPQNNTGAIITLNTNEFYVNDDLLLETLKDNQQHITEIDDNKFNRLAANHNKHQKTSQLYKRTNDFLNLNYISRDNDLGHDNDLKNVDDVQLLNDFDQKLVNYAGNMEIEALNLSSSFERSTRGMSTYSR